MSAVIYKAGQGYWVRALSAVFFGVLVLAGAAWAWAQAGAVDLPVAAYTYRASGIEGEIAAGQSLELLDLSPDTDDNVYIPVGSGVVDAIEVIDPTNAWIRTTSVLPTTEDSDVTGVSRMRTADGFIARVDTFQTETIFPLVFLQAGVAGGFILLGALGLYWFIGHSARSVEFLIATDGEMRKVNWSSPREVRGSTIVVIVAAFLIAATLFIIDFGFRQTFSAIGVLDT